jgi:hypothetical protein
VRTSMRNSPMRSSWTRYVAPCIFILLAGLAASSRPPAPAPPQAAPALDPSKLPDIVGVHLGMSPDEVHAALQKAYPQPIGGSKMSFGPNGTLAGFFQFLYHDDSRNIAIAVDMTPPPNPTVVWHVGRLAPQSSVNRAVILAALRQKYGKESVALDRENKPAKSDGAINSMIWVIDEQGHLNPNPQMDGGLPFGCYFGSPNGFPPGFYNSIDQIGGTQYCRQSFVGLSVSLGYYPNAPDIITITTTDMVDYPVVARAITAKNAYVRGANQKIQQQQEQKSKEIKPAL